ncbi:hypothetical protein SRABI128_05032 [Microbacterium sp. Bi128]|nr:hypothetical protein SRABI128_05032 [Microbacterium sp. Bi128]
MSPQVKLHGLQQRRGIVSRHRTDEVQVIDRMAEPAEVLLEAGLPLLPGCRVHSGRRGPGALRPGQRSGGGVEDRRGQPRHVPGPGREVVQRLLCADGFAVVTKEEGLGGGIAVAPNELVVVGPEGDFACCGDRNDGLHGRVVHRAGVKQRLRTRQQFLSGELPDGLRGPVLDHLLVAGMRKFPPAGHSHMRLATGQRTHRRQRLAHHPPHSRVAVVVIGVAVDSGQPDVVLADDLLADGAGHQGPQRP